MSVPNNPFSKPVAQPAPAPPPPTPTIDMTAAVAKAIEVFGDAIVFDEAGCGRSFDEINEISVKPTTTVSGQEEAGTAEILVANGGDVFAGLDVSTAAGRATAVEVMHRAAVQILESKKAESKKAAEDEIEALAAAKEAELAPMSAFIADYRQRAGI